MGTKVIDKRGRSESSALFFALILLETGRWREGFYEDTESFKSRDHLLHIQQEATEIVSNAFKAAGV
jgi:hypothetical protein